MLNRRSSIVEGGRVIVTAAAARTAGVPVVEEGWAGFPETDAASGARYTLETRGIFEIAAVGAADKGDLIYITDASGVLAAAGGTGLRVFGKVYADPDDPGPVGTNIWIELGSFNVVA